MEMQVKIKKLHPDAIIPTYATDGSACFDLYCVCPDTNPIAIGGEVDNFDGNIQSATFYTGLAFEIPKGYQMLIFSRSGHGFKNSVRLANCVGVIDSDYRGEVAVRLTADNYQVPLEVKHGDRIAQAQILPVHRVSFIESDSLTDTERGIGGFGSTGK